LSGSCKTRHCDPEPDRPAAALLHTKTWFELAPKAANIIVKGEKMGPEPVIKGLWVVTAVVTVVILFVALFW
jgi:fumarate reductase subunit C